MAQHTSHFALTTKTRSESGGVNWTLCKKGGCPGEAVPDRPYCLIHLNDDARHDYLEDVAHGKQPLTLSGLSISGPLLSAIFGAMPTTIENPSKSPRPYFPTPVRCYETTFLEFVDAQHVTFTDTCSFFNATFQAGVRWNGSSFRGGLNMRGCRIYGDMAKFSNVHVGGAADWAGLVCHPLLVLVGLKVEGAFDVRAAKCGGIWLSNGELNGEVKFEGARLAEHFKDEDGSRRKLLGRFDGCRFLDGPIYFLDVHFPYETTFGGYSDMRPVEFPGQVSFSECQFGSESGGGRHLLRNLDFGAVAFTDCTFYGRVSFSGTQSDSPLRLSNVTVKAGSSDLSMEQNHDDGFPKYPALELTNLSLPRGGELSNVDVQGDLILKLNNLNADFEMKNIRATGEVQVLSTSFSQYLTSETAGETISYSRCQFVRGGILTCSAQRFSAAECDARQPLTITAATGAAAVPIGTLDRTNAEHLLLPNVDLSTTIFAGIINLDKLRIEGPLRLQRAPTVIGRGRQVIQDEINIRRMRSAIWRRFRTSTNLSQTQSLHDVASLYRALRKNREDSKDEPGGADFYYGEMEMRRLAAPWTSVDRWLLSSYWLLSGYALRSWRALMALVGVVLTLGYFLCRYGFNPTVERDYVRSLLLLAQTSVGLSRPMPSELTSIGSAIQIAMRIMGPALLALGVLALRGRVKR